MCPAERCNGILFSRGKMAFSKNTALTIVYQKPKKKKKNLKTYLTLYIKINSKWTVNINVNLSIKLLGENIGKKIFVTLS